MKLVMMNLNQDITDELWPYIRAVCGDIRRMKLADAPISGALLGQLAILMSQSPQQIDPMTIIEEISKLEHDTNHAKARIKPFLRQKDLEGLYKAQFFDSPFMVQNILNSLFTRDGKPKTRLKKVLDTNNISPGKSPSLNDISQASNQLISETLDARSKQPGGLTGEWIVMDQVDGRYRYLCLATHGLATKHPNQFLQLADNGRKSLSVFHKLYHQSIQELENSSYAE